MRRYLNLLYGGAGVLACLFLLLLVTATLANIAGRFFAIDIYSADEFAGWCLAASTFLALAATLRSNEHIRVSLILESIKPGHRRVLDILCLLVATIFMGVFAWHAVHTTMESYLFEEMTQGMVPVPLWIPQTGMAAGAVVMLVALLDDTVCALSGREPSYVQAARRHAPSSQGDA